MGPTASGKTALAVQLCDQYPFEIVSVDSMLVYRGMDIGTAKPNALMLDKYPHHLIDIRDPADPYSAAQFCKDARSLLKSITDRNRIPPTRGRYHDVFQIVEGWTGRTSFC